MAKFKPSQYVPAIVAWSLLLFVTGAFYILLIPSFVYEFSNVGVTLTVFECMVALCVVANFFMATVMDPGTVPKSCDGDEKDDFKTPLYKNVEVNGMSIRMKWCVTCHIYRPPRCSHCSVCNHCIENFDHHCPWVNNCIGRRNYRQFFLFLITLAVHMSAVFSISLTYTLRTKENLMTKQNIAAMIIMGLCGLLFVPIVGLTGFHAMLVSRALTTNEQVTGKYRNGFNPFTNGCVGNLYRILCSPQYPRYYHVSKTVKKYDKVTTVVQWSGVNGNVVHDYQENVYILDENGVAQKAVIPKFNSPNVDYTVMKKQSENLRVFDSLSRDSSQVTIATLPRATKTPLLDEPSMMNATMGSKCNLLDDSSFVVSGVVEDAPSTPTTTNNFGADETQTLLKSPKEIVIAKGNSREERYAALLKEAYKNVAPVTGRKNFSSNNESGTEIAKSRSMDALQLKLRELDFTDRNGDVSFDAVKRQRVATLDARPNQRPVSFTQAVALNDSLRILDSSDDSCSLPTDVQSRIKFFSKAKNTKAPTVERRALVGKTNNNNNTYVDAKSKVVKYAEIRV